MINSEFFLCFFYLRGKDGRGNGGGCVEGLGAKESEEMIRASALKAQGTG